VLIVGTGLIGTSIGLALQDARRVLMTDASEARLSDAVARGAGVRWDGHERADLAVVAIPPARTAERLSRLIADGVATTFTHVASCQSQVRRDLETGQTPTASVCGGHPLAGREVTGPAAAEAALFLGRPWVACPLPQSSAEAVEAVVQLAADCGAEPTVMSPEDHDRAVALSSHLPQVAASALAAQLLATDERSVAVSGPGLHDTTRVAASDPELWADVLSANAAEVAPLVALLAADLQQVAAALDVLRRTPDSTDAIASVRDLLTRGRAGRGLVPVKRGVMDRDVVAVAARVPDRPGALAGLLTAAAQAGVNVEDIHVEHLAGRQTGVVELVVRAGERTALAAALAGAGFEVPSAAP
jgi:prephenate dehydrogenase